MSNLKTLANLGWQPFFQQQLTLDEWHSTIAARIIEQHRSELVVVCETGTLILPLVPSMPPLVVGDWILLSEAHQFIRALERKTCFSRKAAGTKLETQLISANVDTAFIVCSMNDDFNLNRIERYLSLVYESGALPVLVLSKKDLCKNADDLIAEVQKLDSLLTIEAINCLNSEDTDRLKIWLNSGATVAVIGSSGVGKSTLINSLLHDSLQATGGIRSGDDKGRHTTTRRSLIATPQGAMLLDTPGMREIQLAACKEGLSRAFAEIEQLADQCRFNDCQHYSEPGCAVLKAIESGEVEVRRLNHYRKLVKEEARNSVSLSEKRASDKALGRYYKKVQTEAKSLKGR